jgi:ABC-type antimicrobial peptide transport system permease subunit
LTVGARTTHSIDIAGAIGLSLLIGLPLGWIVAMFSTPLLWRLEPILHMELAGHSGPSDWIFYLVWAMVVPTLFAVVFRSLRARRRAARRIETQATH